MHKTQFVCMTEAFSVIVDTVEFLAVTAEDGGIAKFPCPFSSLALCLWFPRSCMITSSTPLCVTVTIPSLSLSFPFLLFLFTWLHLHSPTFSHVIKPWVLRYSSSSHALCGFIRLLFHACATLRAQIFTTHWRKLENSKECKHRNQQLQWIDFKNQWITTPAFLPQISSPSVSSHNSAF